MNTNAELPNLNNIHASFDIVYGESLKFIGSEEEKKNWMDKALEDINNPDKGIRLQRISYQVDALSSFSPDQILRLVVFYFKG